MSRCGALPVEVEPTQILVDACLASIRKHANLDAESVLVPLRKLLEQETPKRIVAGPSVRRLPTAEEIVRSVSKQASATPPSTKAVSQRDVETVMCARKLPRYRRWPIFLCAFVAGISGGIALMKSPVGQKPAVQSFVGKAQSHVASAWGAASRSVRIP